MGKETSFGNYSEVTEDFNSVLTGEMHEITIADWGLEGFVKSVEGLPVPVMESHQVPFKNKTLKFTKIANTAGTMTVTFMSDDSSKVRDTIEKNVVDKTRNGVVESTKINEGPVIKVYKNKTTVARTYTLKGSVPVNLADTLALMESDGAPSEVSIDFDFTDYDLVIS